MIDLLGYAASVAVLTTFLMHTMLTLRLVALSSNVLFILYALVADIRPILVLHAALLPINLVRLFTLRRKPAAARIGDPAQSRRFAPPQWHYASWFGLGLAAGVIAGCGLVTALPASWSSPVRPTAPSAIRAPEDLKLEKPDSGDTYQVMRVDFPGAGRLGLAEPQ